MTRPWSVALLLLLAGVAISAPGQQGQPDQPVANPARPTVSTPATLTPVGYFQFESGYLAAWHSPEFSSQSSLNEVVKISFTRRIELLAVSGPFAHSRAGNLNCQRDGRRGAGSARSCPSGRRRASDHCVELFPPGAQWRYTRPRYRQRQKLDDPARQRGRKGLSLRYQLLFNESSTIRFAAHSSVRRSRFRIHS